MNIEEHKFGARTTVWGLITLLLCGVLGCQRYHDVSSFMTDPPRTVAGVDYTVDPPDVLVIRTVQVPEINGGAVIVQPDGKITLPLLGDMFVAGKTPLQIAEMVEVRAQEYYEDVDVVVQVAEFRSKHIYMFGEVGQPGRYAYTGSDTLLDVLSMAQPTRLSDPNRIQLFRRDEDGKTVHRMTIELDKWVKEGSVERNALLQDGDMVFVPPNGLAAVGLAVQQFLLPITPAASVVSGPASIDGSVTQLSGKSGEQSAK